MHGLKLQNGQGLVETALALPILLLLFMGCLQVAQLGLAHVMVLEAAFEAGRQCALDGDITRATQVARDICRVVSPGATTFEHQTEGFRVTHRLQPMVAILKNMTISHVCPGKLFNAGQSAQEPNEP